MSGFALGVTTLLLFKLGGSNSDIQTKTGLIPRHGPTESIVSLIKEENGQKSESSLRQHFCFAVSNPADVEKWDEHLQEQGVHILGRMAWERGGLSVYF